MDKRNWLMLLKRSAINILVVYTISLILLYFFTSEYDRGNLAPQALWGIPLYWVAATGVSIINGLTWLAYLALNKGSDFKAVILTDLRAGKIPGPSDFHPKTFDYLAQIADDTSWNTEDRIKAASFYAIVNTLTRRAGFWGGMAWSAAADDAALRYSEEAPKPRWRDDVS